MTSKSQRLNEDLRSRIIAVMAEGRISQVEVADALGVCQSTVSRYLSYGGDLQLPACLTPTLNSPRLKSLAVEILRFQAEGIGYTVSPSNLSALPTNGDLSDEVLAILTFLGRLSDTVQLHPDRIPEIRKQVNEIDQVLDRVRAELQRMESRR